jgi:hypothetical protein
LRTYDELKAEIKLRKELGLPRIELTSEERARAFGDADWPNRDKNARINVMCKRYQDGLPLSKSDIKEVKRFLKGKL